MLKGRQRELRHFSSVAGPSSGEGAICLVLTPEILTSIGDSLREIHLITFQHKTKVMDDERSGNGFQNEIKENQESGSRTEVGRLTAQVYQKRTPQIKRTIGLAVKYELKGRYNELSQK
ncbi:hypothetical protein RRG08_064290 [Elysia crispata]|uniref:Uncharacterized protein n=1 Tax=Elysia crispata TaxID=231223 RepID=A0AAE0YRY5_9GAST|nr:hypothetical protein RRG08_064290 [Elysia crispata]